MMRFWKKPAVLLAALVVLHLALRVPGLAEPYHQDEYKWALIVARGSAYAGTIPHPPLSELFFVGADRVLGNDHLRVLPLLFSVANIVLLFAVVRRRYGLAAATAAGALYAVSFQSILASLMVDTDGQILPFFFLLAVLGYDRLHDARGRAERGKWAAVFLGALTLGMLTKLSFVIPVGAFALDWAWERRLWRDRKLMARFGGAAVGGAVVLVVSLGAIQFVSPAFDLPTKLAYWSRFFHVATRNWQQVFIQVVKAALYVSPLLIAPLFLVTRDVFRKTRLFWIFTGAALAFYIVLFDFSAGALDRYLQLVVVPFCVVTALVVVAAFRSGRIGRARVLAAAVFAVALAAVHFLPHDVPPLHPKTAWIGRIATLRWNFLFPFHGGSGPLGFYVSFLFIGLSFLAAAAAVAAARARPRLRQAMLALLLAVGLAYNAVFAEEYVFGRINGDSTVVLDAALGYLRGRTDITQVITYNDTGAHELTAMGKYYKRLYVDPAFEKTNVAKLNAFHGHYLVVDVPRIDPDGFVAAFFDSCDPVFEKTSGVISARVLDCAEARHVP